MTKPRLSSRVARYENQVEYTLDGLVAEPTEWTNNGSVINVMVSRVKSTPITDSLDGLEGKTVKICCDRVLAIFNGDRIRAYFLMSIFDDKRAIIESSFDPYKIEVLDKDDNIRAFYNC